MRRTWMASPLVVALLIGMAVASPAPTTAAPKPEGAVLSGVIENCWAGENAFWHWHENANNAHSMSKGMPERWVSLLGGQYFTSESVLTSEQVHFKSDGTVQYHNSYKWTMAPGRDVDPGTAPGWYEFSGVSQSVDSVPVNEAGWIISRAAGVGRGALAGRSVKFEMVLVSLGPSPLELCADPASTRWNGTQVLEINPAP